MRSIHSPIGGLFWFGCLLLAVAGVLLAFHTSHLTKGVPTQGTVVGIELRGMWGRTVYHPVVEYVGGNQTRRMTGNVGVSANLYRKGDKVPVLYLPADPTSAVISDLRQMYLLPLIASAVGAVCVLAALIAAYVTSRPPALTDIEPLQNYATPSLPQ